MVNIDIEEIKRKNEVIDNAIVELKKKYIGVDEQIDEIMSNVRTWYCYPQLQDRPCVINLWGLSGCSKTDSVRTIAKLLDLEEDLIYFNFADINEKNAWEIENDIEDSVGNNKSNRIIVYDEFQYAATLDKQKEEKDNKGALKPFWELLDTGILNKKPEMRTLFNVYKAYLILKRIVDTKYPIKLVNGKWLNSEDYIKNLDGYERKNIFEVFIESETEIKPNIGCDMGQNNNGPIRIDSKTKRINRCVELNPWFIDNVVDVYNNVNNSKFSTDNVDIRKKIYSMNVTELMEFFYNLYHSSCKGYKLDFKDSLVFVIGNLDEAYDVSFNVNPDMSPDQFHKITKKITVVDIKEALKDRFRNEQIARLGNIHVIYPSFSSRTFKGIIDLQLSKYAKEVEDRIGCKLTYDSSIKNIIYREGVFPTHGTRPVFSTIQEIVKSRLPEVMKAMTDAKLAQKLDSLEYSYSNGYVRVKTYDIDRNLLTTVKSKLKLRVDNLRKSTLDDKQALCAVHESGHFVAYASIYGNVPAKLISVATESGTGGFLLQDDDEDERAIKTYDYYMNNIKIALGGYVAERIVFGDNNKTSGAVSDLRKATSIASKMVLELGMYSAVFKSNILNMDSQYLVIDDKREDSNRTINCIITRAIEELDELFSDDDYRIMLKKSSDYLSTHSELPRNKMKEIYSIIPNEKRTVRNDRFYRDKLKDFK
jgi:hypothetical protein